MTFINILLIFSGASFIIYGLLTFISKEMQLEIDRWGFSSYKYFLGFAQLLGGFSLLLGLKWSVIGVIASFCLSVMMSSAIFVRIKIGDPIYRFLPALIFLIINIYLFIILY